MQSRNSALSLRFEQSFKGNDCDSSQSSDSTLSPVDLNFIQREFKKRNRKNEDQIKLLISEFEENPVWSKETLIELSEKTGLSQAQIYKWNWDYKKKQRRFKKILSDEKLFCEESLPPLQFENDVLVMQRLYKINFSAFTAQKVSDSKKLLFN